MKKLYFSAAILASSFYAPHALAADRLVDWSGGYVGVFAGAAFFDSESTDITGEEFGGSTAGATESVSGEDILGGITLGYNFQNRNWVFGPEIEFGFIDGEALSVVNGDDGVFVEYEGPYASFAGRLGYAVGKGLFYGKAGVAVTRLNNAGGEFDGVGAEDNDGILGFDGNEAGVAVKRSAVGLLLGAGYEYALSDTWSLKAEYAYVNFRNEAFDTIQVTNEPFSFDDEMHQLKVGINYRF